MLFTAVIEQTYAYRKRLKYNAETGSFTETEKDSIAFTRNFMQPYGWIKESGTPPNRHLDVILMSGKEYKPGDEERVRLIGVFKRNDGDNKLVAVPECREVTDYSRLSDAEKADLHRLYPREAEGEGWFGRECADSIVSEFFASSSEHKSNN